MRTSNVLKILAGLNAVFMLGVYGFVSSTPDYQPDCVLCAHVQPPDELPRDTLNRVIPRSGLMAYYSFDSYSGDRILDESGRGNHGQAIGASWQAGTGITGASFGFDGIDDLIQLPEIALNDSITISFWLQTTSQTAYWGAPTPLVDRDQCQEHSDYAVNLASPGSINTTMGSPQGDTVLNSQSAVNTGRWTSVTMTWDASSQRARLYINGRLDNSTSYTGHDWHNIADPFLVGASSCLNSRQFYTGSIDELAIYNRALTDSEILLLHSENATLISR